MVIPELFRKYFLTAANIWMNTNQSPESLLNVTIISPPLLSVENNLIFKSKLFGIKTDIFAWCAFSTVSTGHNEQRLSKIALATVDPVVLWTVNRLRGKTYSGSVGRLGITNWSTKLWGTFAADRNAAAWVSIDWLTCIEVPLTVSSLFTT